MQIPLANIHWRFLLVRDDWGFQVNPLCRHDITRSDRQIGNSISVCRLQNDVQIVNLLAEVHMKPMTGCLHDIKGE